MAVGQSPKVPVASKQLPEQVDVFKLVVDPKDPAGQGVQAPAPAREYVPAPHLTDVALVLPAGQACPAMQLPEQAGEEAARDIPYVPAGHGLHSPAPAELYRPTGHTAAVAVMDPAGQAKPAEHAPVHRGVPLPPSP